MTDIFNRFWSDILKKSYDVSRHNMTNIRMSTNENFLIQFNIKELLISIKFGFDSFCSFKYNKGENNGVYMIGITPYEILSQLEGISCRQTTPVTFEVAIISDLNDKNISMLNTVMDHDIISQTFENKSDKNVLWFGKYVDSFIFNEIIKRIISQI